MPITSSSAPLRDLVNQYGSNSPQVTGIVAAVNASPYLENLWNDFAARTLPGGGSPVIRVDPLDDSGRGNSTGRDSVPNNTNADNSRVLLSLDYFRSGPSESSGLPQPSTDQYGRYDLIKDLAHEIQHSNTFDIRRGSEQASVTSSGSLTDLATSYANQRTDDELASKVAEYNALKAAGASDMDIAQRINSVLPDQTVLNFFEHIEKVDTGLGPVSANSAISVDFRRDFNRIVPTGNEGINYGALYLADGLNQLSSQGRITSDAIVSTSIAPQALINAGLRLPAGQSLTLQDPTTGANTQVLTSTTGAGGTEFVYTTFADGGAVVVRGSYTPGGGLTLTSATAFQDLDNLSHGQDVTAQVRDVFATTGAEVGLRGDSLGLVNIGRAAMGETPLEPTPTFPAVTVIPPNGDSSSTQNSVLPNAPQVKEAPAPEPSASVQSAQPATNAGFPQNTTGIADKPDLDASDAHFFNHPLITSQSSDSAINSAEQQINQEHGSVGDAGQGQTPTPYLAPVLKDMGYTGVTGTTPYKPASEQEVAALQDLYSNSPVSNLAPTVSAAATVININFDGTQNNGQFPAPGESSTNVAKLSKLQEETNGTTNTIYLPGVGAQTVPSGTVDSNGRPVPGSSPSNLESIPLVAGNVANGILDDAYQRLTTRVSSVLAENPNAEISLNLSGFSRGGAEAVAFANLLNEKGIPGLYPPGGVPIDTMTLFDPVSQTSGKLNTSWPDNVKSALVIVALEEGRQIMPAMPVGENAIVVGVNGAHCDVGGSYNPNGISAVTLAVAREYQSKSGMSIAEVPESLKPDFTQMNVHNPVLDNYGNTIWSGDPAARYYDNAKLGDATVQDILLHRAQQAQANDPTNPSGVNAINGADLQSDQYKPAVAPTTPDGSDAHFLNHQPAVESEAPVAQSSQENNPVALVNNGYAAPDSVATAPDGSDNRFARYPVPPPNLVPLTDNLTLVNTLIGLRNWGSQSDLSHLSTAVNLYNQVTRVAGVSGPLGDLGGFGAGLGVISALQSGNPIAVASAGASFANAVSTANVVPIPVINALNLFSAIQSGNALSIASSAVAFIPVYGPLLSIGISLIGGLLGGHSGPPPPPDGSVHYTWDETGAITIQTDNNVSGGGDTAHSTASSVLGLVQSLITGKNDENDAAGQSSSNLAIDPSRMPRIGFTAGMSWLEITNPDGSTTKQALDPNNAADQILRAAVVSDAVVPVWQIQTAQAHAKTEHTAQVEAQAQAATTDEPALESATAIDGQAPVAAVATPHSDPIHNTAIFGVDGKASESTDHQSQTYDALVVHLRNPEAQAHMDALAASANQDHADDASTSGTHDVLRDVDGDGYFESTQWVDAKDDAGNTQGLLVLDRNHDGLIATTDILHMGGDNDERNSLAWLDANADGKLDASDPAFAAIKLWVDCNNNGRVDAGEESSLQDVQLGSIDFTTGQVNYTNGQSDALTATTLKADTEGIKLDTIKVVDEDGKLQELEVGSVLVHEGYQGMVRVNSRGEIVADDDPDTNTHLVSQRTPSYEFNAAHLSDWEGTTDQDQHRHGGGNVAGAPTETSVTGVNSMGAVLGKENVKTYTTMEVGDKRLVSDAPKTTAVGTADHKPNTTITLNAGDARIRSLTPPADQAARVVFVPSGVRDGWMTADGKEMLQLPDDGLFGTGGMAGALMAVALGAVQSTAFAKVESDDTGFTWQSTPLMLDGAGASNSNGGPSTSAGDTGTMANQPSTIALGNYATTVHRVRLGVRLSAAPLADAPAASYTTMETGTARTSNTQTPTTATHYASANPSALDANTGPTQTLIDNQLPSKTKTPTDSTTTPPADPTLDAESTASSSPATPTPTAPVPVPVAPGPTLVATPPTAPAAVTPTTANDQLSNPLEDTSLHVSFATLLANDVNASSITAVGNATHGSVAIVGGEVVFTPSQNYHGAASFVYQVVSTDGNFALGQADFDISGVNDVPVALGETASANEDVALVLSQSTLLANDTDVDVASDGQTLRISAVGNASNGTVSILGNGSVQFIADADFHGTASFKYVVSDGHGGSATATATVQVAAVNDVPVALGEVISSAEDTTLLVSQAALLANDTDADVATDGQTLSISAVSNASHGTVSILGSGQIQFIPTANYAGSASFDYVVSDGNGGTATATATVLVGSTDDAPVASGETVNSLEDQSVVLTAAALLANETDIDNAVSSLSISRVTGGAGGSAVLNASGNIVFTPNANFSGTASFTYWVKDPDGMESNPATVTVNVAAVNDAPHAQSEVLSGASEDAVFNIDRMALLGNDGDEEDSNSLLGIELVGSASSGTVAMGAGGNLVFTPAANFNGNVSFQYQVRDTAGALSPTVTAQFNVAAVNDTPLGVDETLTPMYTNTAASPSTATIGFNTLLGNDSDVDNPPTDLTVSGVRNANNGTVSIVGGAVSFTPTLNFNGTASFEYQVDDQHGGQTWATASISVAPPPNLYPSVNVTYANFYPTGSTPAGAFDIGDVSFSLADDGNPGLVSITYLSGSYHVFGDPSGPYGSLPWNLFTYSQTGWNIDIPRSSAADSFDTTWQIVDDRGLANVWHFGYTVGSGIRTSVDFTGYAPPVVLGLQGDVPHYIETYNSNVRFDLNGDGVADQVAWAAPGSGVLGIDLNGDHRISTANEFTFTQYVPGAKTDLQGLRAFDTNDNGVLDAGDAQWTQFGVWEDKDSDGQTQDGEYLTLDALGIASINLTTRAPTHAQATPADGHLTGVAVVGESAFTRTDGSTGQVDDAMFAFTARPPVVAHHSHEAELMRMALLFNQMCNTASDGDHAALGYVPLQTEGHWQDAVVAVPQGALQETFN